MLPWRRLLADLCSARNSYFRGHATLIWSPEYVEGVTRLIEKTPDAWTDAHIGFQMSAYEAGPFSIARDGAGAAVAISGVITNATHSRDAGAVIYYSVGTDNTALYSDTASASAGTLTLNSSAVDKIGVGDTGSLADRMFARYTAAQYVTRHSCHRCPPRRR